MNTTQSEKIKSALRDLLVTNRASIEKDAPFVYEGDTLSGDVTVHGQGELVIGKWIVQIAGPRAHAKVQERWGAGGQFESEVVEVDLSISGDSLKVKDWRAYRGWGKQTGGAMDLRSTAKQGRTSDQEPRK